MAVRLWQQVSLQIKLGNTSNTLKLKVLLVIQGNCMEEGTNCEQSLALVPHITSGRSVIALAAGNGLHLHVMDITQVFIQANWVDLLEGINKVGFEESVWTRPARDSPSTSCSVSRGTSWHPLTALTTVRRRTTVARSFTTGRLAPSLSVSKGTLSACYALAAWRTAPLSTPLSQGISLSKRDSQDIIDLALQC
eukprot:3334116-Rhodomonas_salina.2